jgi:hypothetical protein
MAVPWAALLPSFSNLILPQAGWGFNGATVAWLLFQSIKKEGHSVVLASLFPVLQNYTYTENKLLKF